MTSRGQSITDASVNRTRQKVETLTPNHNNWCHKTGIITIFVARAAMLCIVLGVWKCVGSHQNVHIHVATRDNRENR